MKYLIGLQTLRYKSKIVLVNQNNEIFKSHIKSLIVYDYLNQWLSIPF